MNKVCNGVAVDHRGTLLVRCGGQVFHPLGGGLSPAQVEVVKAIAASPTFACFLAAPSEWEVDGNGRLTLAWQEVSGATRSFQFTADGGVVK